MIQAQIQMEHVSGCAFKLSPDFCVFPFSQAVGALGGHWVTSVCHAVQLSCSLKLLWPSEHAFVGTRETELQQDTEKKGKVTFHGLSKLTTHLHSHTWMYHKCAFPHVILTQHWGQWWPLSRCSLQHLGSFWLEREHCFLERCCLSPGSYCVIFCFILHISAFLLVIVRANVSVCAFFLCIHLFLLSVSPVTLSNFCSYKLTQCCSNIPSPSAAEIPPWDVWSRWQLQLEASQAQTGHDLPVHIYRGASQCVGWRKEMCSIQLVLCLYSCKHNSLLTWKGALEDHSQCAFGWESMQMQGMRC